MKRKFRLSLVLLLGVLLLFAGLAGLLAVPDRIQYAFLTPWEKEPSLLSRLDTVRSKMGDSMPVSTLHGLIGAASLTAGSVTQNDVTLYLVGPSWNEVCPQRYAFGRPISRIEAEAGSPVVVLDEKTAFAFFGDRDPVGQTVKLGDRSLEVVGVAGHSRRVGDRDPYAAWVPLGLVGDYDLLVFSAPASGGAAMLTTLKNAAAEAFGSGTLISLPKEKARATMVLRWAGLIVALVVLVREARWLGGFWRRQVNRVREERKRRYAGSLIPWAAVRLAPAVLMSAVTVAAGYLIALLAVDPARIFPEWVPESFGDFSKWVSWFWSLTSDAANPVSLKTPELAAVRFWGGLIRWGAILSLLGALLTALRLWRGEKTRS